MTFITANNTYDLAAIMAAAWARHKQNADYCAAYHYKLPTFSDSLRVIWERAKFERSQARRKAAVAKMDQEVRAARIAVLAGQLDRLNYLPNHMSHAAAAAPIRRELAALRG